MKQGFGLTMDEVSPETGKNSVGGLVFLMDNQSRIRNNETVFSYRNEAGGEIHRVHRIDLPDGSKKIFQKHNDGGAWSNGGYKGTDLTPYRFSECQSHSPIYYVEGEKCAEALWAQGVAATTFPGGVKGWKPHYAKYFTGHDVIILPDNDKPGREYAETVRAAISPHTKSVRIVELPDLEEKEDIADWLSKGNTAVDLDELVTSYSDDASEPTSRLLRMSDVEHEKVEWLWQGRIPLGFLTTVTGDPGVGKSYLMAALMSHVTKGQPFPSEDNTLTPRGCLYYTAEDSPSHTIGPRLELLGANQSLVYVHPLPISLDEAGLSEIRRDIRTSQPALVVIDPIIAYLKDSTDMHRANEVRKNLAPLAVLARETNTAIVCVRHMNKGGEGQKAIYRGQGSIDFLAAVRSELQVFGSISDPSLRYIAHVKCNLGPGCKVVTYTLKEGMFEWGEELDESLEEIEAQNVPKQTRAKGSPCFDAARDFILEVLAEEDVLAEEVIEGALQNGITKGNLLRAKKSLGVASKKKEDIWFWTKVEHTDELVLNYASLNEHLASDGGDE